MHSDKSAQEVESELQAISDKEKELRKSTRHIDEEIWKLTQRKRSLQEHLQHLRELEQLKKHRRDEEARHASTMSKELRSLRSENRRLRESLDEKRTSTDEEMERLQAEVAALKQQVACARNVVGREKAMKQQREENCRQIDSVSAELESLRRVSFNLRSRLTAAEAMATETRLRQLNQLKYRSAETEQLRQKLNSKHLQRQQLQQRQLREAHLQHLGNTLLTSANAAW